MSQKVWKPVIASGAKQSRSLQPIEESRLPRRFAPRNDDTRATFRTNNNFVWRHLFELFPEGQTVYAKDAGGL